MESCKYNLRPKKPRTYNNPYSPYFPRTKKIKSNYQECNGAMICKPQEKMVTTKPGDSQVVCDSPKVVKKLDIESTERRTDGMAKETPKRKVRTLKDRQPLSVQWKDLKKRSSRNNLRLSHYSDELRLLERLDTNLPLLTASRPSLTADARPTTEPYTLALVLYQPPVRESDEPTTSVSGNEQNKFPTRQVIARVDHSSQQIAPDVYPRVYHEMQTVPQGPIVLDSVSSTPVLVGEATVLARPRITPGRDVFILRVRVQGEIRFLHVDPNAPSRDEDETHNNLELTEEVIGRHPETIFGNPIVIDGTTYCVVKFQGCDYTEIVVADQFFQEFPELEDNFSHSTPRRIAAPYAAPLQQTDDQDRSEDVNTGENLPSTSTRRFSCCIA